MLSLPVVLDAEIQWEFFPPDTVQFTLKATLRRNAFGGEGAAVEAPAGTGPLYGLMCKAHALPDEGDIFYEGIGGTRLLFGDGESTKILCFEAVDVDESGNRMDCVALDPASWYRGIDDQAEKKRTITHQYTRKGPFIVSVVTARGMKPYPDETSLNRVASVRIDPDVVPEKRGSLSDVLVAWQETASDGSSQVFYHRRVGGNVRSARAAVSRRSVDNSALWVSQDFLVFSGLNQSDGKRKVYCVSIDELDKKTPEAKVVSPEGLIDNRDPRINGDWILGTGIDPETGSREVWAVDIRRGGEPRIVSTTSSNNSLHVAISDEHATWSGWDPETCSMHLFWQDLLDPGDPVRVSTPRVRMARASGDVYHSLRVLDAYNPEQKTRDVFFRTVPVRPENPMTRISTTSVHNSSPRNNGVQAIFEGTDPSDGMQHLYLVRDVTAATESELPARLTDSGNTVWPKYERNYDEEAYWIDRDWVAWVGMNPKTGSRNIFARSLATLESSTITVSEETLDNRQPHVRDNLVTWRGMMSGTGIYGIHFADLAECRGEVQSVPIEGSDTSWPFIVNLRGRR